jgi:hypothetical protein
MWRKILGYLLIIGSAAIVAIAIALALEPDAELWQSIGPLLLASLFFVQGRSYLSKGEPALATDETELYLEEKRIRNTLERLKAATPRFLANFMVQDGVGLARGRYSRPDFVVKQVACACGSENVELLASRTNDGKCLAPIYLRCLECSSRQLLFDPAIHGWDGEGGNSASRVGEGEPTAVAPSPGTVFVVYSYQGIENYEDLIEGGAANPENFFDTFAVYFVEQGGTRTQVVSYECA